MKRKRKPKEPPPPVPLADVTQQGWATTGGLKVFIAVSHRDPVVQEELARVLRSHVEMVVKADSCAAAERGESWHTSYTTQGLASLLRSLELPRMPGEDRVPDDVADHSEMAALMAQAEEERADEEGD